VLRGAALTQRWHRGDIARRTMPRMNSTALSMYARFGLLAPMWLPITAAARGLSLHDPSCRRSGHALRSLARTLVRDHQVWDFGIIGRPPADLAQRPCVVVANHASLADPFLLAHLPFDLRFVAKAELFRAPLVGWLLRLGGDIPIRRGDAASARAMSAAAATTLRCGVSLMIFPEGTRSHTGALGPFRDGAIRIAIAAGARLLPVALHGTRACIGPDGPRRARARAEILAPIETQGLGPDDVIAVREQVRGRIAAALGQAASTRIATTAASNAVSRSPSTRGS
jgi:1-acyl-sn-glycerol-3-phosphate acyltransferase